MKRLTTKSLVALLAMALTGAAVAALFWLVATTSGARWFLATIPPWSGVTLSAQKVEGRIIDHLLLSKVQIGLARQRVEIETLELRWQPLLFLTGTVAVDELRLNGVQIQDDTPIDLQPPVLAWPQVPKSAQRLSARITQLRVTDFRYRRLQEEPMLVESLSGSVTWDQGILSLDELKAVTPSGQMSGTIAAGFAQPSLLADLAMTPVQPLAQMDHFTVQVRRSLAGTEPFVGTVKINGSTEGRERLEVVGEVGMTPNAFHLRQLRLHRPGEKGLLTADGSLRFIAPSPILSLQVKVEAFDLAPELHLSTNLDGTLSFAGTLESYRGELSLTNSGTGWQGTTLTATYQGNRTGIKLAPMNATLLDGSLTGNLELDWREGLALQGTMRGTNLNPARLHPAWQGVANFTATAKVVQDGEGLLNGSVNAALLESRLHGQELIGELRAEMTDNHLLLSRLALQGKSFDLHAAGELNQHLNFSAQISDLSRLVPDASGAFQSEGWVRWRDGQLSGAATGTGSRLAYGGTKLAAVNLTTHLDPGSDSPLQITATLRELLYAGYTVQGVKLMVDGALTQHRVHATIHAAGSAAELELTAGYRDALWEGEISRLSGRDSSGVWQLTAPTTFAVSAGKVFFSPLLLSTGAGERLEVAVDLVLNPLSGQLRGEWSGLNLARANPWLQGMQIAGESHGTIRIDFLSGELLTLTGRAGGRGTFTMAGHSITLQQGQITFDGNPEGMRSRIELNLADGGTGQGTFSSTAPLRLSLPEQGELTAELSGIDLSLFNPWLPDETKVAGRVSAQAKGSLLPGGRFTLDGHTLLSAGKLQLYRPEGELNLTIPTATTAWRWHGEELNGNLALTMGDLGQAQAEFLLPLPARFPVSLHAQGPLRGKLTAQMKEKGMITTLFPELVQKSFGDLDAEVALSGSCDEPIFEGKVRLARAGAYLPTVGLLLKGVELSARLEKNLIRIDSFRALSGPGHIEGTALINLAGWQVVSYQGELRGENFQTIYHPELQIFCTPKLNFAGTPEKFTLRGELLIPELKFVSALSHTAIEPSSDVIREGRAVPEAMSSPLALDIQIRILLGERVHVAVAGIDAQLGGAIELSLHHLDRITSSGEIKVIKGRYRTYGVNLDIVHGSLYFAGDTIDRPSLDFLALRTIGEVKAGVTVAGTLQQPLAELYSEPSMPDVDILAYIVLGHPLESNGEQVNIIARAASVMLTSRQGELLREQLKNRFGLSTLEIQGGVGSTSGFMGYKSLSANSSGAPSTDQQVGITETMLTVGKYLTPKLYISYGRSLLTGNDLFRLRYDIHKKWQIETESGSESGVDLLYKLDFN